jgi:hypothetical protein
MKTLKIISVLFLVSLFACKNQDKKVESSSQADEIQMESTTSPKTYAEISIAQGGEWKGRVYEGGTSFKNVTSLKIPKEHTDHSWYIRYEGPGWESNKVGYRLYLDWRNAIDIFGKVTDSIILPLVGQDGFDSYHEMQPWGTDILKVGKGLGVGSLGRYVNNEVLHFNEVDSTFASVENSTQKSSVNVEYYGWKTANDKIDLKSTLTIRPDNRYTMHTIHSSKAITGICTGIVDHGVEYFTKESTNKKWAYIATYGEQTLVPDDLGMAIFYEVETVAKVIDAEFDNLLEFKPTTNPVSFYFLGAWEQEKDGIKTKGEFLTYLNEKLTELNTNNKLE